eukprot:m.144533 g.144533  ORF g.144533 m.144533 type:complete len:445 (+) comp30381_c0_seq1:74-1408(+)
MMATTWVLVCCLVVQVSGLMNPETGDIRTRHDQHNKQKESNNVVLTASLAGSVGDIQMISKTSSMKAPLSLGIINSTTGVYTASSQPLVMPDVPSTCKTPSWYFTGTHGQTSTTFLMNRSVFFLAQLQCNDVPTEVMVLRMFINGYYDPNDRTPIDLRPGPRFNSSTHLISKLERWNIAWDWVCNFIVLAPSNSAHAEGTVFETLMISEYDGAVRPQKSFFVEPATNMKNGWVKVDGLGGIDFDGESTGWPYQGNCGDTCVQYAIEAQYLGGNEVFPRRIIGRMFHTSELASNVTDSLQAQTMSYYTGNSWLEESAAKAEAYFVGLGVCCEHAGCAKECAGNDGDLVLFGYDGGKTDVTFLTVVSKKGAGSQTDIDETIRLGVQLQAEPMWSQGPIVATIYVNKAVVKFKMSRADDGELVATHIHTSPTFDTPAPLLWTPAGMD